jgi:hypothetical protein
MANAIHPSDSSAQRDAGREMLDRLGDELGVVLEKRRWSVSGGASIEVNGMDSAERYAVQVHARLGSLKVAQKHAVANDVLKLILLRDSAAAQGQHPALILAFANREALDSIKGWLLEAIRLNHIDLRVVPLSDETVARVRAAQQRQVLGSAAVAKGDTDE